MIYRCAQGSLTKATTDCMYIPSEVDVDDMIADADQYEADGLVDPLSGLDASNVYIFHGTADWTVNQGKFTNTINTEHNTILSGNVSLYIGTVISMLLRLL